MAHQFHGEPLRHSITLQKRRPGVAQRVEIPIPAQLIPVRNAIGFQVQGQTPGAWNAIRKDQISRRASGWPVSGQRLDNFRHQLHGFFFFVLGRIVPHHHEWNIGVQAQITPFHLLQFLLPQSCPRSGEINDAPIFRPGHQLAQFLIRKGPAHPLLFAPLIRPGHVLERVGFDSGSLFHPVQQRDHALQVMVECARRAGLTVAPDDERIGGDIARHLPITFLQQNPNPGGDQPGTATATTIPAPRRQVRHVIVKVSRQRLFGGITDGFRFKNASGLALALLDKLMPFLVGNLFIRHTKRFPLVHRHVTDTITQIIRPCFLNFSTPAKPPFFNRKDHAVPFTIICSMSLNRNRTAPRILTVANFPDATSLSTILTEQASRRATSFFVTN